MFWLTVLIGFLALCYIILTVLSIRSYRKEHQNMVQLVGRCIACKAVVLTPVVLDTGILQKQTLTTAVDVIFSVAGIPTHFSSALETVWCKVQYSAQNQEITTILQRRAGLHHPKQGDSISIFYDPLMPTHAFAKDMEDLLLRKPFRECVLNGIAAIVLLLSFIFLLFNPETLSHLFSKGEILL